LGGYIPFGDTITLQCKADGLGSLIYMWERRQSNGNWTVIHSDNLTTFNTTIDGFYRCIVENEAGSVVSIETQVHVYGNIILLIYEMQLTKTFQVLQQFKHIQWVVIYLWEIM